MGEIVNLNKVRKGRARLNATEEASRNRALSGLTKKAREEIRQNETKADQALDAKRLED